MTGHLRKGRLSGKTDPRLDAVNVSLPFDRRLAEVDILGSRAHAAMLGEQGLLRASEVKAILKGLAAIEKEIADGIFPFRDEHEDIHMNIEVRLGELIGADKAGRLHLGRSRNDQVALDLRLWLNQQSLSLEAKLKTLLRLLGKRALEGAEMPMPGYTHLQPAQVVSFGHHALAHAAMLERDLARFADARKRMMMHCPLGAGALAGSGLALDPSQTAKQLGFAKPVENSLDAVADRDFALEWLGAAAITAIHLSKLGEEMVLWASPGFDFIDLPDSLSTTSSMLPQKRNPDGAELLRAMPGKMAGSFIDLLMTLKALPLAYAKDLQQDKQAIFSACDLLLPALDLACAYLEGIKLKPETMAKAAALGYPQAVDLANWLAVEHGLSFREAHTRIGQLVTQAGRQGKTLHQLDRKTLLAFLPEAKKTPLPALDPQAVLSSRSPGGPAPKQVRKKAKQLLARLAKQQGKKMAGLLLLALLLLPACGKEGAFEAPHPQASWDVWETQPEVGPEDRLPPQPLPEPADAPPQKERQHGE